MLDRCEEVAWPAVVARGDATEPIEAIEESLDKVAPR